MKLSTNIKLAFILLLFLCSLILQAQTKYEKGFYIDNSGNISEGFIKNIDWLDDPLGIVYKVNESGEEVSLGIDDVAYFEVGKFKFKRFDIQYDLSYSDESAPSSTISAPNYIEKTVFLRLIVEGKANLYKLGDHKRFYFTLENDSIIHLLYKRYKEDKKIQRNESYKSSLFENLKCETVTVSDIQRLEFKTKQLIRFFESYNECSGDLKYVFNDKEKKKIIFHLSPVIGIRSASISQTNSVNPTQNVDFGTKWGPAFGLNIEYVLPFNNNKWSVFFEPYYHSYTSEIDLRYYRGTADYSSIELHFGLRYYMFLSKSSTLFLNATLMNNDILIKKSLGHLKITSGYCFTGGLGYLYKSKVSLSFRLSSTKEILNYYAYYRGKYNSFDIALAYRIF
jgi:hypothetical protein